jgi:hypothetical protein
MKRKPKRRAAPKRRRKPRAVTAAAIKQLLRRAERLRDAIGDLARVGEGRVEIELTGAWQCLHDARTDLKNAGSELAGRPCL